MKIHTWLGAGAIALAATTTAEASAPVKVGSGWNFAPYLVVRASNGDVLLYTF